MKTELNISIMKELWSKVGNFSSQPAGLSSSTQENLLKESTLKQTLDSLTLKWPLLKKYERYNLHHPYTIFEWFFMTNPMAIELFQRNRTTFIFSWYRYSFILVCAVSYYAHLQIKQLCTKYLSLLSIIEIFSIIIDS